MRSVWSIPFKILFVGSFRPPVLSVGDSGINVLDLDLIAGAEAPPRFTDLIKNLPKLVKRNPQDMRLRKKLSHSTF